MKIPCIECLVLAICKCKTDIICELLYPYLEENIQYDPYSRMDSSCKVLWKELESIFKKDDYEITIDTKLGSTGMYVIAAKNKEDYNYII